MTKPNDGSTFLDEDDDEGGTGGQTGSGIPYSTVDPSIGALRDDLLSAEEIKRLLIVGIDLHEILVEKQKQRIKNYADLKAGKLISSYQLGAGAGMARRKQNRRLRKMAGLRDIQVISDPALNEADTNEELKDKLENQLKNRLRLRNAPKFNPKPRPY